MFSLPTAVHSAPLPFNLKHQVQFPVSFETQKMVITFLHGIQSVEPRGRWPLYLPADLSLQTGAPKCASLSLDTQTSFSEVRTAGHRLPEEWDPGQDLHTKLGGCRSREDPEHRCWKARDQEQLAYARSSLADDTKELAWLGRNSSSLS